MNFLAVYLISVFLLLAIIGYLFFENGRTSMQNAMKFEMMYQGRMLSSSIVMKAMHDDIKMSLSSRDAFLKQLHSGRFQAAYFDQNKQIIYSEIEDVKMMDQDFMIKDNRGYTMVEDKSNHLGVRYIILKEYEFFENLNKMRLKIIWYLLFSFLLMGVVGYVLGRLFLRPVREQIEALDRFISDTTHELNTPISAILMTIGSLKGIEERKLKRLEASAKRLEVMYRSLTYRLEGKVESPEWLYLADIIKERVDYVKELIETKHLKIRLDLDTVSIFMDKPSSSRLIDNLLSNAIKYSDVGDTVTIRLKQNVLEVEDTGIGIAKEAQEDIFKRYHRANSERGGFGIGLDIVLSICKRYDIILDVESTQREGSTFRLTFPKYTIN
jgi:two-component system OmpR family sensor kinase